MHPVQSRAPKQMVLEASNSLKGILGIRLRYLCVVDDFVCFRKAVAPMCLDGE